MKKIFSLLLCLVAFDGLARAQALQFTIDATATDNVFGYVAGNSYQFTVKLAPSYSATQPSDYMEGLPAWNRNYGSDEPIFSTLNGFDITGVRQWLYLRGDIVQITIPGDGAFVGLTSPSGMQMSYLNTAFNFVTAGATPTYADPATALAPFTGSFAISGGGLNYVQLLDMQGNETHAFTVTNVTLASSVPEPATYAAMSGLAILGFVVYRRRRALRA